MNAKPSLKRGRGRPRGTGIDDSAVLKTVADTLAADPRMRPTTAMKRCVRGIEATPLRRLQEKWKANGPALLAEAEQRIRQRQEAQARRAAGQPYPRNAQMHGVPTPFDSARVRGLQAVVDSCSTQIRDLIEPPGMKAMLEMQEKFRAMTEPPGMKAMLEMQEKFRAMAEPPGMKAMLDLQEKFRAMAEPTGMRAMRALTENPAVKMMQRVEEMIRRVDPLWRYRF